MKIFPIYFLVCTGMLILSCERNYKQEPLPPDVIAISTNTQARLKNVNIGAGNFGKDEYEDADGNKGWGQTARLWINVENEPPINDYKGIKVGKGSKFSAGQFSFEVLDVTSNTIVIRYSPPL